MDIQRNPVHNICNTIITDTFIMNLLEMETYLNVIYYLVPSNRVLHN